MRLIGLIRGVLAARSGARAPGATIDRLGLRCAAYRAARDETR